MNFKSFLKSIKDNWDSGICLDTVAVSNNGARIKLNYLMLIIKESWMKSFYQPGGENVVIFPQHSQDEINQFVHNLYSYQSFEENNNQSMHDTLNHEISVENEIQVRHELKSRLSCNQSVTRRGLTPGQSQGYTQGTLRHRIPRMTEIIMKMRLWGKQKLTLTFLLTLTQLVLEMFAVLHRWM